MVVNWNTPDLTSRSVAALLEDGADPARVVIVDNGSGDDSAARFSEAFPSCELLALPENIGCGRAASAGARALGGTAYLFVNNDAFVRRPGSLEALVGRLEQPEIGIVVPRILNEDGSLQPTITASPHPA